MAKFEVLERSFINHRIYEVGEMVEHEFKDGGEPGPNLKPVDGSAKPARPRKGAKADTKVEGEGESGEDLT